MAQRAVMTFHHILSARKITQLHAWSGELGLQGIIKVGYPGLLLLADRPERAASHVAEYVRRVKRMRWQTCELRILEDAPSVPALCALQNALAGARNSHTARRSALAHLDTLKQIAPILRDADYAGAQRMQEDVDTPRFDSWEAFYRRAMRP
ncbi:hypothetical protein MVES1_003971 [Malassezia vespertilionis]|uniref:uncharacterized protein n=1 Tax=Malassezia vespertilionis TaxID=2020962 RepID=UPI0024B17011|nr:uncharacterized protein MVES1_003971 [Malassezia vespertilionis]WFD08595.1 hypothetical protein MVES1_003971 [Malassezia vespertilionis]